LAYKWDYVGWEPSKQIYLNKFFRKTKETQYELAGSGKIVYCNSYRSNFTCSYKTAANNAFVKGITKIYLFVIHGYPYHVAGVAVTSPPFVANSGITIMQHQTIEWKPVMHSLDTLVTKDKYKLTSGESYCDYLTADSTTRLEAVAP